MVSDACEPSGGSSAAGTKPCSSEVFEDADDDELGVADAAFAAFAASAAAAFALLEAPNLAVASLEMPILSERCGEREKTGREGKSAVGREDEHAAAAIDAEDQVDSARPRRRTSAAAEEARARLMVGLLLPLLLLCLFISASR